MCNRYRLTAKQAEIAATFGIRPPYEPDETYPVPDIFPTGKKTPFYGQVVIQDGADRKIERMEWGVPTQVPSKRDPAVKLTKYVTNVRNLSSSFWRSMLTTPGRRCLVPVTAFSEFGIAPGEDGKKPLHWFDVPSCLIPRFDGAILSLEWKEAIWDRYVTGAPRPRTPSEQQYSDRKLRSRR